MSCPGTPPCSGHGKCVSISQMAQEPNAVPFGGEYSYGGNEATTTWDENMIMGCVCDSSWDVGYGPTMTQATEWFGPDCSLKHCPSGDDPRTATVETDCTWMDDNGKTFRGWLGSDGNRYLADPNASPYPNVATWPSGVVPSVTPAPTAYQYGDAAAVGKVPNAGAIGNKCHIDCSNRGTCDYSTGTCTCFKGYQGNNCGVKSTIVR